MSALRAGREPRVGSAADRGLQVERTVLAWHRTAAAYLVAAAVSARLLTPLLGGWAYLVAVTIALCALAMLAAVRPLAPLRGAPREPAALPVTVPRPGWMATVAALTVLSGLVAAAVVFGAAG